jgi:hypothetical protein
MYQRMKTKTIKAFSSRETTKTGECTKGKAEKPLARDALCFDGTLT